MQSYVFNLAPNNLVRAFDVPADLFVYESGVPTPTTGDTRIKIKPNTGAEMVLRPGQRFRLAPGSEASHWEVSALDPSVTLTGYVIIGSGEFDDANTLNKFTLDATLANNVTVTNTPGQRVPTSADLTQTIPVSIAGTVNVAGNTVQYTNSFADAGLVAITAQQIFAPASNPNGAYVEFAEVAMSASSNGVSTVVSLIAKATAPTSQTDGDVLMVVNCSSGQGAPCTPGLVNQILGTRIKIPAGKGLYLNQVLVGTGAEKCNKTVLYSLL